MFALARELSAWRAGLDEQAMAGVQSLFLYFHSHEKEKHPELTQGASCLPRNTVYIPCGFFSSSRFFSSGVCGFAGGFEGGAGLAVAGGGVRAGGGDAGL
jgi:hypothetical protein